MPADSTHMLRINATLGEIIARYASIDEELGQFYSRLRSRLQQGKEQGIFPCQQNQISNFLAELPQQSRQISQECELIVVTGRRTLVALNDFLFSDFILDDEVFFRNRTLFVLHGSKEPGDVVVRLQLYHKGKLAMLREIRFECIRNMNQKLAVELITLEYSREFDGLLVEIGIPCPDLGRFKIVAAPKVDATIKELLEQTQLANTGSDTQPRLCLMLHYFTPGSCSEVERRVGESELNYVRSMATRCQLVLAVEHRRGTRPEVEACVQKYRVDSMRVCYYVQWQWDGLSTVQPEIENALAEQLHKRSTQLAKRATKELSIPFKIVHQIKRNVNLARNVANTQRRPQNEYMKDFKKLRKLAASSSEKFRQTFDEKIREVSVSIAEHLRSSSVRSQIVEGIFNRALDVKGTSEHNIEILFLGVVAEKIREWNARTQVLTKADEAAHKAKMDVFRELCARAGDIPEIVLVSEDLLSDSESTGSSSRDSSQSGTFRSVMDDMVRKRLRSGRLEAFAAGIAAPLWVPLAAITMAIIAPVMGAQRGQQSDERFREDLKGQAQDFLDRLDSQLIRTQFFATAKQCLEDEASKLKDFIQYFCILPADYEIPYSPRLNDSSLMQHMVDLEHNLQLQQSHLLMLQLEKLGCDVLSREACKELGVNVEADDFAKLGEKITLKKPVYLVSPSNAPQKPLVLKVATERGREMDRVMLEIEILKSVTKEGHTNIIPWLGTVYFPKLRTVGFLTHKYDFNLWEFLQRFDSLAVPFKNQVGSAGRSNAFAVCRNTCKQIFSGVYLLHSKQILHRDLKLENVLVEMQQSTEPLRFEAKLCDFGLAKHETEMSGITYGGTNGYMAPELQSTKPLFSTHSDVYALGVIAWECFFGQRVFNQPEALRAQKTEDTRMWDFLVESMTSQNAMDRPVIEQCLRLLGQFDKPDLASSLDPRFLPAMPSFMDSLQYLKHTFK